ncbi:MAG TPA: acyl-CoA dehydrogenase family protein [Spirochaetota bacterium]|nr:acyl-CoA dehydrogenase family protein [Spirochaetota bacterium]
MEERTLCFALSEEQSIMKETTAKLVQDTIAQNSHEVDEKREIPGEYLQKFWELGSILSAVPEEYGGYGMGQSPIMSSIILEELAFGDMSFAIACTLPSLFLNPIIEFGTEEQKKKYIPPYCTDKYKSGTLAICEPHFGFDPQSLKTTAQKKGGSYVINGKKCFIPYADESDHMLVAASVDGKNSLFIVSRNNPGMSIGQREKNLGLYCLKSYSADFNNCEVPAEDRLGGDDGLNYSKILQKTRTALSAIATGVSRASFEYARDYAKERSQFGEPIASRQAVAFMIAEMAYEVDAMRLMTWKAATALEVGNDATRESYLAKIFAGDMTMKITDYGVQILGGHGYVRDHPVERFYRNGRGIAILEGMAAV